MKHHQSFLAAACAISALGLPIAIAAPDDVDNTFANTAGQVFDPADFGSISSILIQQDGKIVFGSNEMQATVDGSTLQIPLIRFNPDGTTDNTFFADNDPDGAGTGIYFKNQGWPEVHALAQQADGKLIAAGVMEGMDDGTSDVISRSIVRINPDGTVDPSYQTEGTLAWEVGSLNYIEDLRLQADQKLIVAGGFKGIRDAGAPVWTRRYGLARLNADGTVDTGFSIDPFEFGVPTNASLPRGWFRQAVVDSAGRIYVVGQFEHGGTFSPTIVHVFARLRPDGSRDMSFNPAIPASVALYKGVALDDQGRVLFLGDINNPATDSYIARFDPDGSLDTSFTAPALGRIDARPLRIDPSGRILLAQNNNTLIRLNADGTLDTTFNAAATYVDKNPFFSHWLTSAEGRIYSGAYFEAVQGVSTVKVVSFEGDNTAPNPGSLRFRFPDAVAIENAGSLYIPVIRTGGRSDSASIDFSTTTGTAGSADFTSITGTLSWADGDASTRYITIPILQDALTEGPESFSISLTNPSGASLAGSATIPATILDDDTAPVILQQPADVAVKQGEDAVFSVRVDSPVAVLYQWQKDGVDIPGATKASLTLTGVSEADEGNYSVVITNPGLPGSPVTSDTASLTVIPPAIALDPAFSIAPSILANDLAVFSDGSTIINSGNFSIGFTLVKLNPDGSLDTSFTEPAITYEFAGSSNSVRPIPLPGGKVIITGNFTAVDGQPRAGVARLNADGSLDTTFVPTLTSIQESRGAVALPNGDVFIAVRSDGLRRFLDDGTFDPTFSTTLTSGSFGFLYDIEQLADGSFLVAHTTGSTFSLTRGIARLNPDGSPAAGFNPIGDNTFEDIAALPDGRFAAIQGRNIFLYQADGNVDPSFNLSNIFSSSSIENIIYKDGRFIISGPEFYGDTFINGLARLNLDGTFDDNFPGGSGPNAKVSRIAIDAAGRIYAQGVFTSWNGDSSNRLARLLFTSPEVGFAQTALIANEVDGSVSIDVRRSGNTDEALSVRVISIDGTATSPDDYIAVDTILSWAAGESADKTVSVNIVNDANVDGDHTFSLRLLDGVGGAVIPLDASITLIDDDSMPAINTQPVDLSAVEGQTASLSVVVDSPTPVSYQWFKDNVAIAGATSDTYTIAATTPADVGSYYVVATNDYRSVTSDTVSLSILKDPAAIVDSYVGANFNSVIYSIAPAPDGGAYVGGAFWQVDADSQFAYLAKVNPDGSLDTSFVPPALNSSVRKVILQSNGKILIAGGFTNSGAFTNRGIARLNPDGSYDAAFMTNIGTASGGSIDAIDLLPDGSIVVGDGFTSWNGTALAPNADLIRLNPDGSLDGAYAKNTASPDVEAVKALPDGSVLAGRFRFHPDRSRDTGFFAVDVKDIDLHPDGDYLYADDTIRKYNPDGTVELTIPDFSWDTVAAQLNGKILAGGNQFGYRLKRYLPDGTEDTTFIAPTVLNNYVSDIALTPSGEIWVAGNFSSRLTRLNGDPVDLAFTRQPNPASVERNPGESVTFSVGAYGSTPVSYQWRRDGVDLSDDARISGATTAELTISGLIESDEGSYTVVIANNSGTELSNPAGLVVLGAPEVTFLSEDANLVEGNSLDLSVDAIGATPITYQWFRDGSALADGNGISGATTANLSIDAVSLADAGAYSVSLTNIAGSVTSNTITVTVSPNPAVMDTAASLPVANNAVRSITPLPDGRYILTGDFTSITDGSVTSTDRIAVMNPDGSLVDLPGLRANGRIWDVTLQADGKILLVGGFTIINGESREHIARLNADFTLDAAFNPTGLTGVAGEPRQIVVEAGGTLMLVGTFVDYAGQPNTAHAVRLTADGQHDPSFFSGAALYNYIYSVIPLDNGDLIFGGPFYSWGADTSYSFLIRTLPNGGWSTFNMPGNSQTGVLFPLSTGDFISGPSLSFFGSYTRKISPDGTRDTTFLSDGTPNNITNIAIDDPNGNILMGGDFTTFGALSRNRIARILPDGTMDLAFDPAAGFDDSVFDIELLPDGRIMVAGAFTHYRNAAAPYLAVLKGDATTPPADPVADYLAGFGVPEPQRQPDLNFDNDPWSNVFEYVYNLDPTRPDPGFTPFQAYGPMSGADLNDMAGSIVFDAGDGYMTITTLMPIEPDGVTVDLTASTDLVNFGPGHARTIPVGTPSPHSTTHHWVTYAVTNPVSTTPKAFFRLEVQTTGN